MERNLTKKVVLYFRLTRRLLRTWLHRLDPSVVRFKNPRRFPRWVMGAGVTGIILVVGAATVAAVIPGKELEAQIDHGARQDIERTIVTVEEEQSPLVKANPKESSESAPVKEIEPEPKKSDFYDPVYVFFDGEVERVSAYPLASPPGVVVDLKGTPEPDLEADEFVGKDPRIRSVKRRATASGIRYIIGLTTPIKRVNIFNEGGVVMVFPVS